MTEGMDPGKLHELGELVSRLEAAGVDTARYRGGRRGRKPQGGQEAAPGATNGLGEPTSPREIVPGPESRTGAADDRVRVSVFLSRRTRSLLKAVAGAQDVDLGSVVEAALDRYFSTTH